MMEQPTSPTGFDPNVLVQRVRRLAMLDTTVFDEIRGDATALAGSAVIAALSFLLFGLGGWLWYQFQDYNHKGSTLFLYSVILGTIVSLLLWAISAAVIYVVLTQILRARADMNELVRVLGYAAAPLALGLLLFVPGLDMGIGVLSLALFFVMSFLAVQSVTDASAGKALTATAAGFAVFYLLESLLVQGEGWKTISQNVFLFAPR